ncbi:conserved hypothetical protein [Leishmania major strain Friedlin]|uniref:Uncharacterized protein n=1 Tax=Leishmania major TaxID=5664 RepID=Q4Q5B7_LEIMA|nr:conserved hypothetical protein [Leishmania major strain Friedlin]CAG9580259.1 hypothetical_protein_-_conserved [Leishmania major strain Friedlin]CAJ08685.1 conserved hypothetical protein [Leishmania major strain Friedlin]|eukprot:XP_001685481.1 conserved hypothetical protein [Leishmania major strain Friedlin]
MALLLDDEEVFVGTANAPPQPAQPGARIVLDSASETTDFTPLCAAAPSSKTATSAPSTAAATRHRERSPVSAGALVTLPLRGGDGMEKMEALLCGKTKVALVRNGSVVGLKRSADEAVGAAVFRTPVAQRTSLARLCDGRIDASSTQPKIVSAARSLSSPSPQQELPSTMSLETVLTTPHERSSQAVVSTSPEHPCGSPFASPPARPTPTLSASAREETVVQTPPSSVATQPAKMQMKLSDFFSKMACKR